MLCGLYFNNIVISGHTYIFGCGNMEMPVLVRFHDQLGHLDTKTAMCLNFVGHFSYEKVVWVGIRGSKLCG